MCSGRPRDPYPGEPAVYPKKLPLIFVAKRRAQQVFQQTLLALIQALPIPGSASTQRIPGMEYHAVPPEERARDEQGNLLPWGYVYKE